MADCRSGTGEGAGVGSTLRDQVVRGSEALQVQAVLLGGQMATQTKPTDLVRWMDVLSKLCLYGMPALMGEQIVLTTIY